MPFAEGSFASVLATEVIEHIEDYQGAIVDIARVTARQALGRDTPLGFQKLIATIRR